MGSPPILSDQQARALGAAEARAYLLGGKSEKAPGSLGPMSQGSPSEKLSKGSGGRAQDSAQDRRRSFGRWAFAR